PPDVQVPGIVHADHDHDEPWAQLKDVRLEAPAHVRRAVAADAAVDDEAGRALEECVEGPHIGNRVADEHGGDGHAPGQQCLVVVVEDTATGIGRDDQSKLTGPDQGRALCRHMLSPYLSLPTYLA